MHICLLFEQLKMGGTETLMLRMSKWLTINGYQVTVLSSIGGELLPSFPRGARVIVDEKRYLAALYGGEFAARDLYISALGGRHIDVFYAFSDMALWVAASLVGIQAKPSRLLAGVYHPRAYRISRIPKRFPFFAPLVCPAAVLFRDHLPESCRMYMSDTVRRHVEAGGPPIPGRIWPLPVDIAPFRAVKRTPCVGRIVSVGRLAHMKEYNLWMIDVVCGLVTEGLDVCWEVYGDGPYRELMERRVCEKGLSKHIILRGTVPYELLASVFAEARVFVGMGTSLIEAASAGIPSVSVRPYDRSGLTYGFLHELPEYACGEEVDLPLVPVKDKIRHVLGASPTEYERLVSASREHAERFDLQQVMQRFLEEVHKAPELSRVWRPSMRFRFAHAFDCAMKIPRQCVHLLGQAVHGWRPNGKLCENMNGVNG